MHCTPSCSSLSDLNISACIIWIPGHHGIAFNECADRLAKQLAYDIFKDRVSAPSIVSFASAVKVAEVGTKILFPDNRDVGVSYCRMLLHDTMLNEDAYRTGTYVNLRSVIVAWKGNLLNTFSGDVQNIN